MPNDGVCPKRLLNKSTFAFLPNCRSGPRLAGPLLHGFIKQSLRELHHQYSTIESRRTIQDTHLYEVWNIARLILFPSGKYLEICR